MRWDWWWTGWEYERWSSKQGRSKAVEGDWRRIWVFCNARRDDDQEERNSRFFWQATDWSTPSSSSIIKDCPKTTKEQDHGGAMNWPLLAHHQQSHLQHFVHIGHPGNRLIRPRFLCSAGHYKDTGKEYGGGVVRDWFAVNFSVARKEYIVLQLKCTYALILSCIAFGTWPNDAIGFSRYLAEKFIDPRRLRLVSVLKSIAVILKSTLFYLTNNNTWPRVFLLTWPALQCCTLGWYCSSHTIQVSFAYWLLCWLGSGCHWQWICIST